MPKKLNNLERIRRADALISQARPICAEIPLLTGQKRGQAVRRARSLLGQAERWVARMANARGDSRAVSDSRKTAQNILREIDGLWPNVLGQ